jgi:hypothetical protein
MKLNLKISLYVACLFVLFAKSAHAYVDPGTGSYIFQVIIASLLGGLFFIKKTFRSIKFYLTEKLFPKKTREQEAIIQDEDNE